MWRNWCLRRVGSLLLLASVAACGEDDSHETSQGVDSTPNPPAVLQFDAQPEQLIAGEATSLRWRTRDALSIAIADETGTPVPLGDADPAQGMVEVRPAVSTTYTLTATGVTDAGGPAWRSIAITVEPPTADAPTIESFTATPTPAAVGTAVTLAWTTTNADRLTLKDDAGVSIDVGAAGVDRGQVTVSPTRSPTSYELVATGPGGRADGVVTLLVSGLPAVTNFWLEPMTPVAAGDTVTLHWETENAQHVSIERDGASVLETDVQLDGSLAIAVTDNTTFSIEATGVGDSAAHATATAQVGPRIVAFDASERVVRAGDPVVLSWLVEDADRGTIDGPGGYQVALTGAALASGSATVDVTAAGDFVLHAFRGAVPRTGAVAIELTEAPRIRALSVDRATVTAAADLPGTVTLSWEQDGADTCTIVRDGAPVAGFVDFPCGRTGSAQVQIFATSTLRLIALNAAGQHTATVALTAIPPARVTAFAVSPNRRLAAGSAVQLSWAVTDAVSVSMEKNGVAFPIGATSFTGTAGDHVDADSTYVLTARNSLGDPTVAEKPVRVGAPVILSAAAEPSFAGIGSAITLRWTLDGGETLVVTAPDGTELLRSTDTAVIDAGSVQTLVPIVAGTYQYTLTVTDGTGGSATTTIAVIVSDGPMIHSLTANKSQISLGEALTLSWNVTNDPSGNVPTLSLTDSYGHTHDLTGKNPNLGSVTITPTEEGPHVYTLTADTGGGRTPATATVAVEISVAPALISFTATPDMLSTQGGTVVPSTVLAWQSHNAVEISLWESDSAGNVVPPAFQRFSLAGGATQAQLDAGSITMSPTQTTWYVVRAHNRLGSTVDRRVKVIVDPPEILTLALTPDQIIAGGSSQLSWTTRYATSVSIDPPLGPLAITTGSEAFVDVSATGTLNPLSGDDAVTTVPFPAGFSFPYDGEARTAIQVSTNGWAGFNLSNTSASYSPSAFPNSSRFINFSLLWCDLHTVAASELWSGLAQDAQGQFLVIQWKGYDYLSTGSPSNLNFELILRPSGLFEFRYSTMDASTTGRMGGEGCGIGYQYPGSSSYGGNAVPNATALAGGLANRSFLFAGTQAANGGLAVSPATTTRYTLTALNADGSAWRQASLKVWGVPTIATARAMPATPTAGNQFRIEWTTTNATQVRVLDGTGAQICLEQDPAAVAAGTCTHTENTPGPKTYTVEAANGPLTGLLTTTTRTLQFTVFPVLSLDSFTVTPGPFVHNGDQVTIAWSARGATEMMLLACRPLTNHNVCTDITPATANPLGGTLAYTMTESVDFWMKVFDVQYRLREAAVPIWVDPPTLDSFTASTTQVVAGGSVTLNWTTTGATTVSVNNMSLPPPIEITSTAPFIDVSLTGTPVTPSGSTDSSEYQVQFPAGFTFPWFGTTKTALRATTDGWLTFDTTNTSYDYSNSPFPDSTAPFIALAPFWDDLQHANVPLYYEVRTHTNGIRYLVVQWKGMQFYANTGSNLNFEAVLWENGDVDYRYAALDPSSNSATTGASATIGWQSPDRAASQMLGPADTAVPGGLTGRSWRYRFSLDVDGSATVTPTDSTTYRLCAKNASLYDVCQEHRIVVVRPGDVLITEAMIAPASIDHEWFEVRNAAPEAIDLAGWQITSGAGESFILPATPPLVLQPGQFRVFARSATADLAPDLVYGTALTFADATDEIRLLMTGTPIDVVSWSGTGWTIQADKSIALEPSVMARASPTLNDAASAWCATTATYGAGTLSGSPGTLGAGCLTTGGLQWYVADPVASVPFLDIAATGTDDSAYLGSTYFTAAIPLGFNLPYFADTATSMQITKHGYLTLAPVTTYYTTNGAIPNTASPNGLVAPLWDTLYSTTGTAKLHHQARQVNGANVMIVQWTAIAPGDTTYGTLDFQVQLWASGDIAFVYRNVNRVNASYNYTYGSSATIGLENLAGNAAVQLFNGSSSTGAGYVYSGRSVLFHHR